MSNPDVEARVRSACDARDYNQAATLVLECYGRELLLFVSSRLRDRGDADDAFSELATKLWNGLPAFGWRSSVQTWAYTLARNVAIGHARRRQRLRGRNESLDGHLSNLVERVRTETEHYRRTETRNRIRVLRDRLRPDDRTLLALRVDRGMDFLDLARVMSGDNDQRLDDSDLKREAARLRKRFERIKTELRRMAEDEGLLEHSSSKGER